MLCVSWASGRAAWTPAVCCAMLLEFTSFGQMAMSEHSALKMTVTQCYLLLSSVIASNSSAPYEWPLSLVMTHILYAYHCRIYIIPNILEINILYQCFKEL